MSARGILAGLMVVAFIVGSSRDAAYAAPPKGKTRVKFYDFSEQLIDGEIKKPTALYTDVRQRAKFERLLKLKRSFMRELFDTAREKVFK